MSAAHGVLAGLLAAAALAACTASQDVRPGAGPNEYSISCWYLGWYVCYDKAQQICSRIGREPLASDEAAEIVSLSRASIQYPAGGKLVGNWKVGEKLAHDGAGDRIQGGRLEQRKENGGLCQNCHALAPGEINVGNVGPALTGYGAERGSSAAIAKITYEKIYNNWAYYPCSNMPRLGATGHLTPEQITHLVAYLIDPQSPLNRTRKP